MKSFWDERYSHSEYAYGEKPNEYFKQVLLKQSVGNILLPLEGEGRNAVFAAKQGWTVSAFDQSEKGKCKAEKLAEKNNVKIDYHVSDIFTIELPENSFDAVALIYAHLEHSVREKIHKKFASSLKKGGLLIMEGFSVNHQNKQNENPQAGGPKDPAMMYTPEILKNDFPNFDFLECYESEILLNEGIYHSGSSMVVRALAVKIDN